MVGYSIPQKTQAELVDVLETRPTFSFFLSLFLSFVLSFFLLLLLLNAPAYHEHGFATFCSKCHLVTANLFSFFSLFFFGGGGVFVCLVFCCPLRQFRVALPGEQEQRYPFL